MSHIFISYSHDDKSCLEQFVSWLREHDYTDSDFWYDEHIGVGNNWRDEIASALDEAFAVVLIITNQSIKSLYCTYEWAYAMGQGIPIIPLTFEEVSISNIPSPLTSRQFINCQNAIPSLLNDQLSTLKSIPPQVKALNRHIAEITDYVHRSFFLLCWIGDAIDTIDESAQEYIRKVFSNRSQEAYKAVTQLMLDKAFAFTGRPYRHCWTLAEMLEEFSSLGYKSDRYFEQSLAPQFDNRWLPAYEYFSGKKWSRWMRSKFERTIDNEYDRLDIFTEFIRVFPQLESIDVDELINNTNIIMSQKKNRE